MTPPGTHRRIKQFSRHGLAKPIAAEQGSRCAIKAGRARGPHSGGIAHSSARGMAAVCPAVRLPAMRPAPVALSSGESSELIEDGCYNTNIH